MNLFLTKQTKTFIGCLVLATCMQSVRPVSEDLPAVAGWATFAALFLPSLYFIHRTDEGHKHEFTGINVALSCGALIGSAAIGAFAYKKLRSTTPTVRFDIVRKAVEMCVVQSQYEDVDLFRTAPRLRAALSELGDLYRTVKGIKRYRELEEQIMQLGAQVAELLIGQTEKCMHYLEHERDINSLISDHSSKLSNTEYLGYIQSALTYCAGFEQIRAVLQRVQLLLQSAHQNANCIAQQNHFLTLSEDQAHSAAQLKRSIETLLGYVGTRVSVVANAARYAVAVTTVKDVQELDLITWVTQEKISDGDYIERLKKRYSQNGWYICALKELENTQNKLQNSVDDLEAMLKQNITYLDEITVVAQQLAAAQEVIKPRICLIEKVNTFRKISESYDNLINRSSCAELLTQAADFNDGELWDWSSRKLGSYWGKVLDRELNLMLRTLKDTRGKLESLLRCQQAEYLDTQVYALMYRIQLSINRIDSYHFLSSLVYAYDGLFNQYEQFRDQSRLRRFMSRANNNISQIKTLRIIHEIFSDTAWPLVESLPVLDRTISDLADLRSRATELMNRTLISSSRRKLMQRCGKLEQELIEKVDQLSKRRKQLLQSKDYISERDEREEYERDVNHRNRHHKS